MPAGLPPGIPGIGLVMDGAIQQAPQPGRQPSFGSSVAELCAGRLGVSVLISIGFVRNNMRSSRGSGYFNDFV